MRYRTKSADVLNEADRFQRIMEWQLFCSEQENQLWGYDPDQEWTPGTPIHQWPYRIDIYDCGCDLCENADGDDEYGHHYFGNHVRPIFEVRNDEGMRMWCTTCEVRGGQSETACWMCGEDWDNRPNWDFQSKMYSAMEFDGDTVLSFDPSAFLESSRAAFARMSDQLTAMAEAMQTSMYRNLMVVHPRRNGFTHMFSVMDEYSAWDVETTGLTYSIKHNRMPNPNPFVREDKPIELVPPVAPNLTKLVQGYVRIPADVDLSGRVMPELPQMPKYEVRPLPTGYGPPTTPRWRNR
jgi:hypothetical protein